jgi:hypothetical protein
VNGRPALCTTPPLAPVLASTRVVPALALSASLALIQARLAGSAAKASLLQAVVLLPLCGLSDKTLWLAARAEHYFTVLVCLLFAGEWQQNSALRTFSGITYSETAQGRVATRSE